MLTCFVPFVPTHAFWSHRSALSWQYVHSPKFFEVNSHCLMTQNSQRLVIFTLILTVFLAVYFYMLDLTFFSNDRLNSFRSPFVIVIQEMHFLSQSDLRCMKNALFRG